MDKLYAEMKPGARLVMLFDSVGLRDGLISHSYSWQPVARGQVLGNVFRKYVR
jgi:hypothetical protein